MLRFRKSPPGASYGGFNHLHDLILERFKVRLFPVTRDRTMRCRYIHPEGVPPPPHGNLFVKPAAVEGERSLLTINRHVAGDRSAVDKDHEAGLSVAGLSVGPWHHSRPRFDHERNPGLRPPSSDREEPALDGM